MNPRHDRRLEKRRLKYRDTAGLRERKPEAVKARAQWKMPGARIAGGGATEKGLNPGGARCLRALLMAVLACLAMGCVGVLPLPSFSRKLEAGRIIRCEQVAFIVPAQTMFGEVTNHLGCEFRDSPRVPALAYSWELAGGRGVWWAAWEGSVAGEFEWSHWRAFFVLLDERGVVIKTKFARLSGRRSLDEQLEKWGRTCYARRKTALPSK